MKIFLSETNFDFKDKTVLIRIDCDVDYREENGQLVVDEDFRLRSDIPTIKFLLDKGVKKIILLGHVGRPEGKVVEDLSLEPVGRALNKLLAPNFQFLISNFQSIFNFKFSNLENVYQVDEKIFLLENLRFDIREDENDQGFAKELASLGEVYINEAFGVSHRKSASVVGIPKFLPSFLGLRFEGEMKVLARLRQGFGEAKGIREIIKRPLVFVLGGSKSDKMDYLEFLGEWCDQVLVGGKIPLEISNSKFLISKQFLKLKIKNLKFVIAELNPDSKDINEVSINRFKEEIRKAMTIVWAGPMGVYEEKENEKGTYEIGKAIAESSAFKVAGGGDTHRILSRLDIGDKFDFVSVGGGAMLSFLKNNTLPGIEAIKR